MQVKLNLKSNDKDENGKYIYEEKTFVMPVVMARILKRAMQFEEKFTTGTFKSQDLDDFIDFYCACYSNQFTIDDVWDSIPAKDLLPTIAETLKYITTQMGES